MAQMVSHTPEVFLGRQGFVPKTVLVESVVFKVAEGHFYPSR
jgi:hypothetical protein